MSSSLAVGAFAGDGGNRGRRTTRSSAALTETTSAALVIVDHPLVGVGPDMFPIYYEQYAQIVGFLVRTTPRARRTISTSASRPSSASPG